MAVPASDRVMVWLVAKASLAVTVSVDVPAASAMVVWLSDTDSVAALSLIVTVCCEPTVLVLCVAVISIVSESSSAVSADAVTVAVTEVSPAFSVSLSELMV